MRSQNTFFGLIITFIISLLSTACNDSDSDSNLKEVRPAFTVSQTEDVNFPKLTVNPALDNVVLEWIFPDDKTVKGKKTVVHYFAQQGEYDVTLKYSLNGKSYSYTEKVKIASNSAYYERGEDLWWSDEFEDDRLDYLYWNYDLGSNKSSNLWGNNELQKYTASPDNSFLRDGKLVIRADTVAVMSTQDEDYEPEDFTSARLTTKGKIEFNRGRIEVKAKLGGGRGLWPGIWLYQGSANDGIYSELDIMEYVGIDKNIIYSAVHTNYTLEASNPSVGANITKEDVENTYHIYGLNWLDDTIEFYVDDPATPHLVFSPGDVSDPNQWPFDKKLYIILNVAVGGDWGGMRGVDKYIFPQETEIEYVRIFQMNK